MAKSTGWLEACPLRRWREAQNPPWSTVKLSRRSRVARMTIHYWERGKNIPRIDTWELVEAVTGIAATEFIAWLKEKPE